MKSWRHVGKHVKCVWCSKLFTNNAGLCLHLESGTCASSSIDRQRINRWVQRMDKRRRLIKKARGLHADRQDCPEIATSTSWDGDWYRCRLCGKGFSSLRVLNRHLASPFHEQKIYHCPRERECQRIYTTLSGLVNHLEAESCGPSLFVPDIRTGLGFMNHLIPIH